MAVLLIMEMCFGRFTLKKKGGGEDESEEITVYDYFVNRRNITLQYSADLPCINVGKPKRPTYVPIEVDLVLYFFLY